MKLFNLFSWFAMLLLYCTLTFAGSPPPPFKGSSNNQAQVARGKYLTTICACNDCHTPKIFTKTGFMLDTTKLLSGHAENDTLPAVPAIIAPGQWGALTNGHLTGWAGPWGKSFARNLTPDTTTGLGSWNEEIFIKAIRTGKDMGEGRPILPPMPWEMYRVMNDDDLKAIFAYLKTLPPVVNAVPDPIGPGGEPMPTMKMK